MSLIKSLYEKDLYPELDNLADDEFSRDCIEIASQRLANGEIDRRSFLSAMTILAALPTSALLGGNEARAAAKELLIANWGGPAVAAYENAFGKPFQKTSGVEVVIDGTGPLPSKVKAMVQSGAVTWDICDMDAQKTLVLANEDLLEPIDYNIVDKSKMPPDLAYEYGAASYYLCYVLTYDKDKIPVAPTSWKDFWDLEKFPGNRTMRKQPDGQLEAAKEVYPIDLELAKAKLKEIRPNLIAWGSGSESQQLFHQGEVVMGNLWHTRATVIYRESKGRFAWTWNEGLQAAAMWNVVKGNPAGRETAMQFIASTQDPMKQIELLSVMGSGPINPAAAALVPEELKMFDPGQPAHSSLMVQHNPKWFLEPSGKRGLTNDALAREIWLDVLAG
mgnify:CR=1 FL=1